MRHVIDRDRYVVAIGLEAIRKAVGSHAWLLDGRGPYAWDDDDYRREFGDAMRNVQASLAPLAKVASDKSDCTTDSIKIAEARAAAHQYIIQIPISSAEHARIRREAFEEAAKVARNYYTQAECERRRSIDDDRHEWYWAGQRNSAGQIAAAVRALSADEGDGW